MQASRNMTERKNTWKRKQRALKRDPTTTMGGSDFSAIPLLHKEKRSRWGTANAKALEPGASFPGVD